MATVGVFAGVWCLAGQSQQCQCPFVQRFIHSMRGGVAMGVLQVVAGIYTVLVVTIICTNILVVAGVCTILVVVNSCTVLLVVGI